MKRAFLVLVGALFISTLSSVAFADTRIVLIKATGEGSDPVCSSKWGFYYCSANGAMKNAKEAALKSVKQDAIDKCTEKGGKLDNSFEEKVKKAQTICRSLYEMSGQSYECRAEIKTKCMVPEKDPRVSDRVVAPDRESEEAPDSYEKLEAERKAYEAGKLQ